MILAGFWLLFFVFIGTPICLMIVILGLIMNFKRRRSQAEDGSILNSSSTNYQPNCHRPEFDAPPDYEAVVESPATIFVIDSQSLYSYDGLPTYEEAKQCIVKMEGIQILQTTTMNSSSDETDSNDCHCESN